jgi:activator of 2-hydroxyglutaryl-CoA dehydratase
VSSELKIILSKVAVEDNTRKEIEFEEGINRYKSLLLMVAKVKPFDMLVSSEGTEQVNMKQTVLDLDVLERAHLIKGQTKETNHNVYRQYELTAEGAELVEKFSKEIMSDKDLHQPHTLDALSSHEIPVTGVKPNQIPCPECGKTFKTNSEMENHRDSKHHETKGHE